MKVNKFNPEHYYDLTPYSALKNIKNKNTKKAPFMPLVFICSPFKGDVQKNINNARRYSKFAVKQGVLPIAPHLLFPQFMDDTKRDEREYGILMGIILLKKCGELWWFGDTVTQGMSQELEKARRRNMKIRHFSDDCVEVEHA